MQIYHVKYKKELLLYFKCLNLAARWAHNESPVKEKKKEKASFLYNAPTLTLLCTTIFAFFYSKSANQCA